MVRYISLHFRKNDRSEVKRRLFDKPSRYISVEMTYILYVVYVSELWARYGYDWHDSYCVWQTRNGQSDKKTSYVSGWLLTCRTKPVMCRDGYSRVRMVAHVSYKTDI